jgi:prepilin-type N-terminal cleavage/methylation domain-containing protein
MNLPESSAGPPTLVRIRTRAAFTLPEMMISLTVFLLLLIGIIGATLFGMRWFQISQTKLLASDSARESISKMTDEIRSCSSTFVGNVTTNGVFTGCTNGSAQTGTGLLIYPSTNTSSYILYFVNPPDQSFRRLSTVLGSTTIVAQTVTNTNIFQITDFLGNVQSNNTDNRVIHCRLQFYQTAPNTPTPQSYTLDTAVTRRAL